MDAVKQFDNLNTSYVNLAALLRYLRGQEFSGSIHVALDEYEAEIFLKGSGPVAVFEIDRGSGVPTEIDGAMERALVHAREPGDSGARLLRRAARALRACGLQRTAI